MQAPLPPGEVWMTAADLEHDKVVEEDVKRRGVDDVLVSSGRLAFDEGRVAHINSPVSGRVVRIDGSLGQHVDKGQILAVLSSPDLGDATSALSKATADLIAYEHAYHRLQGLHDEGGASDAAVEQAQDAWRTAKAEVERAQEKVSLLHAGRNVTESYPLTSPIAGTILARNVTPGFEIQGAYSGGNQPELFTVGDLEEVWLYADVYESDLGRVHAGQAIDLTVVGIPTAFHGSIDYLADMLDPQTRTARLRCTIANPEHKLEPEMYGTVRVHVAPIEALAIPRKSILHLGDQQLVFVDRGPAPDGRTRFERMPVVADETGADPYVPVTHGVDENQRIVISGGEALSAKL
ncbi:MAG: efflux RND transporter periplasmic adaptor subunit [Polyangiaceae bacterium]